MKHQHQKYSGAISGDFTVISGAALTISRPKAAEKGSSVGMAETSDANMTQISGAQTPEAGTSGAAVRRTCGWA